MRTREEHGAKRGERGVGGVRIADWRLMAFSISYNSKTFLAVQTSFPPAGARREEISKKTGGN